MNNTRVWIYRGLVLLAVGAMVASFCLPWWALSDIRTPEGVRLDGFNIYGYGFPQGQASLQWESYWKEDITPTYQIILAWAYVFISAGLLLYSTRLKGIKSNLLAGGIGLIYTAYAWVAVFFVIANRLATRGHSPIPLQGEGVAPGEWADVTFVTSIQPGFYFAFATGGFIVLLAILRRFIIGKPNALQKK